MIYNILRDYKMLNCEVLVRDENGTPLPLPWKINMIAADLRSYG